MKHSGNVDLQNVDNEVTSEIICIFYFWPLIKPSEKEFLLQNVDTEITSQMMYPYLFAFVGCPVSPGEHS